jgi:amidase
MTRSVADAAALLDAISGFDPLDPTSLREASPRCVEALDVGVRGLRIGLDEQYVATNTAPETTRACFDAVDELRRLGATVVAVDVPSIDEVALAWGTICAPEALAAHAAFWPARAAEYGVSFRRFLEFAEGISAADLARAHRVRLEWSGSLRGVFERSDVLVCPSAPLAAVPAALLPRDVLFDTATAPFTRFTAPFDFSGSPTLSLPCGRSEEGFLHSLQLVGRHCEEALLCRVGRAYERATEWHRLHPAL